MAVDNPLSAKSANPHPEGRLSVARYKFDIPCPNYEIEEASDWNASWQLPLNCLEDFEFHDASHPTTDSVSLSEQDR